MRTLIFIITLMLGAVSFNAFAEDTMTFVAGSDVCTPITVSVGGKSHTVYSSITVTQTNGTVRATDCNGRKLKYNYEHRSGGGSSADTYTFHNAYDVDRDYGNSGSYGGYDNSYSYNSARNAGRALGGAIFGLGGGADGDAYPSLQLALGISRVYGENIRLKYTGYGFHAFASVGKDFLLDSEFNDIILWNVGLGSYFAFGGNGNPTMDISLGLSIGQQAQWEKLSLMIDVDYTYWIGRWRRVGIFAGGGIGWGSFTEMFNTEDYSTSGGFAWNIEAGITIRLANF